MVAKAEPVYKEIENVFSELDRQNYKKCFESPVDYASQFSNATISTCYTGGGHLTQELPNWQKVHPFYGSQTQTQGQSQTVPQYGMQRYEPMGKEQMYPQRCLAPAFCEVAKEPHFAETIQMQEKVKPDEIQPLLGVHEMETRRTSSVSRPRKRGKRTTASQQPTKRGRKKKRCESAGPKARNYNEFADIGVYDANNIDDKIELAISNAMKKHILDGPVNEIERKDKRSKPDIQYDDIVKQNKEILVNEKVVFIESGDGKGNVKQKEGEQCKNRTLDPFGVYSCKLTSL